MPSIVKQSPISKSKVKSGSVIDRIAPIGFDNDEGIKILLYGMSGSGKTTTWATFPKPILSIICSGGNKSGELRSVNTPENRKTISQVVLESSSELKEIFAHQKTQKFATIVLDHATGLQDLVLKEVLGLDELPAQLGWGVATQQQYGTCTLQCKEYMRALLGLDCNVVIVSQEREFKPNEEDSEVVQTNVGAALTPSLVRWLNPAVDYICQTFKKPKEGKKKVTIGGKTTEQVVRLKGVDYCLRTGAHDLYTTKFRVPKGSKLPEYIIDPDYEKIMAVINGEG